MKKLSLLFISLLLCSCAFKEDYYTLNVGGYNFTVGYDDVDYLKTTFSLDIKDELEPYETVSDIEIDLFGERFATVDVVNDTKKTIDSDEAKISRLSLYCGDVGDRSYKINDIELDSSVTSNCNKFNGTLVERNGYACVIECTDSGQLNVIELHGDILAKDQDKLDRIIVYIK